MDDQIQAGSSTVTPTPSFANAVAPAPEQTAFPPQPQPSPRSEEAQALLGALKSLTAAATALTTALAPAGPSFMMYGNEPAQGQPIGGVWAPVPLQFDCPEGKVQKCERCEKAFTATQLVPYCGQHCAETALAAKAAP